MPARLRLGPQGEPGPAGIQGETGSQGPQGEVGTANVIYSEWIDLVWNGADEDNYKRKDLTDPMITEEFASTGTVLIYLQIRIGDSYSVYALPFTTSSGQMFVYFIRPEGLSENLFQALFLKMPV